MRRVAVLLAAVLLAAVIVAYGRSEGRSAVRAQQHGLLALRAAVGSDLPRPTQALYDRGGHLECFTYDRMRKRAALELCFDASGALIEGVDRRQAERIWSVRWERSQAPLHIAPKLMTVAAAHVPAGSRYDGLLP